MLKHFYNKYVRAHMTEDFPEIVSYNRFVELQQSCLLHLAMFVKTCLMGQGAGISFVDSTPLRVCSNKRIKRNKVFEGGADTGKSTMGWFHGFKLHIVTGIRSNMKNKLTPMFDKVVLRKRSIIETINDQLKNISQVEHTRHRSVTNFATNLLAGIAAYCFQPKKPAIFIPKFQDSMQLVLFNNRTQVHSQTLSHI